jgi:hypothetical protein
MNNNVKGGASRMFSSNILEDILEEEDQPMYDNYSAYY